MSRCPACGSARFYPSRLRSVIERFRRAITERQPCRCHKCDHRGWYPMAVPLEPGPDDSPDKLRTTLDTSPLTAEDLERLDKR